MSLPALLRKQRLEDRGGKHQVFLQVHHRRLSSFQLLHQTSQPETITTAKWNFYGEKLLPQTSSVVQLLLWKPSVSRWAQCRVSDLIAVLSMVSGASRRGSSSARISSALRWSGMSVRSTGAPAMPLVHKALWEREPEELQQRLLQNSTHLDQIASITSWTHD